MVQFNDKVSMDNEKEIEFAKTEHEKAKVFLDNIIALNTEEVKGFIVNQNKGKKVQGNSKTLILIDATISMSQLLHKTKSTL